MTDRIVAALAAISNLLRSNGQDGWRRAAERAADEFADADPETPEYQDAVRNALQLFQGGMGSFNDVVLEEEGHVLEEQRALSQLRQELLAALVDELR